MQIRDSGGGIQCVPPVSVRMRSGAGFSSDVILLLGDGLQRVVVTGAEVTVIDRTQGYIYGHSIPFSEDDHSRHHPLHRPHYPAGPCPAGHPVSLDFFVLAVGCVFHAAVDAPCLPDPDIGLDIEEKVAVGFAAGIDKHLVQVAAGPGLTMQCS